MSSTEDLLSLEQLCSAVGISEATGKNWLKSDRIIPTVNINGRDYFSVAYKNELKAGLKSGKNGLLRSRRNKSFIAGNAFYKSYVSEGSENLSSIKSVLKLIEDTDCDVSEAVIRALLAECALRLISDSLGMSQEKCCLSGCIEGKSRPGLSFIIDELIGNTEQARDIIGRYPEMFSLPYYYESENDTAGLLYISLRTFASRKAAGAYYTPYSAVKKLCGELFDGADLSGKKLLDPSCGTGNFMIRLPDRIKAEQVYANDIDPVSVCIARLNYALKYHITSETMINEHITCEDYLLFDKCRKYDIILGNPPWGVRFSADEKKLLSGKYECADGRAVEIYDLFIEKTLSLLNKDGMFSFILPEAILNVGAHTAVRKLMIKSCGFRYAEYLGDIFDGVNCPCIILRAVIKKNGADNNGIKVKTKDREFVIGSDRTLNEKALSFFMTDEENRLIEKLDGLCDTVRLYGNAEFALGIVTGQNKSLISDTPQQDSEPVLKGADIRLYRYTEPINYIRFKPDKLQQTAPERLYRAEEKLVYRFICSQPVFAYDDKGLLTLNSCNIVIPRIENMNIKYILALLNSRTVMFYLKKRFNSIKLLRSHIEQIPLPAADKQTQFNIISKAEKLSVSSDTSEIHILYDSIDRDIAGLYGLSAEDHRLICSCTENRTAYLM